LKPPSFDYLAPQTVSEAVQALAVYQGARLLAGGQSLVPAMNLRLARPDCLIDINRITGLSQLEVKNGYLCMGARVTHHAVACSTVVAGVSPVIARTAAGIGHDAIRRRGTVCGSLAHADPAAQWPLIARLFAAQFDLHSVRGQRRVPVDGFFQGIYQTAIEPDEMLVEVGFELPQPGERSSVRWFSRRHGDFMIGAVGMRLSLGPDGRVDRLMVVGGGFEPQPSDLSAAFSRLRGRRLDRAEFQALIEPAARLEYLADLRASASYRRALLQRLLLQCFDDCMGAA
jgi:aerobic carbon-monoxide dehydrogenase medium subunit